MQGFNQEKGRIKKQRAWSKGQRAGRRAAVGSRQGAESREQRAKGKGQDEERQLAVGREYSNKCVISGIQYQESSINNHIVYQESGIKNPVSRIQNSVSSIKYKIGWHNYEAMKY